MNRSHWRRFLPRRKTGASLSEHDASNILARATSGSVSDLNLLIEQQKKVLDQESGVNKKVVLENLLVLQTPRAALAQQQMDQHEHGYHNREKRLYELIDFNDTFVATVLEFDQVEVKGFAERIKVVMTDFCHQLHTPMFNEEQFNAIVRGLAREIAVYRGASAEGFDVQMTNRTEDAFGIDMVITDLTTRRSINIDCKTPSAFRYRLEELVKEGKITDDDLLQADEQDYCMIINRHNEKQILVTIMCVRPERLGEITDFMFEDTKPLATLLHEILARSF
jgi:hypothetical protein